jgi:drug/metabolite transporter (DMT)-like permease
MEPIELGILLMSVLSSSLGQLFLKLGAVKMGAVVADKAIGQILSILTIPELIVGLGCYGVGAVFYILLLTRVDLSVAGPSASLVYVFSIVLGATIFHEILTIQRLIGLGLIVAGVVLVASQRAAT